MTKHDLDIAANVTNLSLRFWLHTGSIKVPEGNEEHCWIFTEKHSAAPGTLESELGEAGFGKPEVWKAGSVQ